MGKHTPGPWFVRYCDDERFMCMTAISSKPVPDENMDQYADRDASDMVAIVYHQSPPFVCGKFEDDEDCAVRDANALLIASSPELLEALQSIIDDYEFCKAHPYYGDRGESFAETARVAIARATGSKP